jgi:Raf kinase inhibitor-like YbhB/YbcL family protein
MQLKGIICLTAVSSVIFAVSTAIQADEIEGMPEEEVKMAELELKSNAFKQGETIPKKYTCDGEDISPQLSWGQPPEGTRELILICDDPDAPVGTWDHWVLYGLAPDTAGLPEGIPTTKEIERGGLQGKNGWGNIGYGGPCPPKGPAHRYFFKLYAVDKALDLKPGATKKAVLKAMEGHILAQGELMGKYAR